MEARRAGVRRSRLVRLLTCGVMAGGAIVVIFGVVVPMLGSAGPV